MEAGWREEQHLQHASSGWHLPQQSHGCRGGWPATECRRAHGGGSTSRRGWAHGGRSTSRSADGALHHHVQGAPSAMVPKALQDHWGLSETLQTASSQKAVPPLQPTLALSGPPTPTSRRLVRKVTQLSSHRLALLSHPPPPTLWRGIFSALSPGEEARRGAAISGQQPQRTRSCPLELTGHFWTPLQTLDTTGDHWRPPETTGVPPRLLGHGGGIFPVWGWVSQWGWLPSARSRLRYRMGGWRWSQTHPGSL